MFHVENSIGGVCEVKKDSLELSVGFCGSITTLYVTHSSRSIIGCFVMLLIGWCLYL